jgi:hypothetical protein
LLCWSWANRHSTTCDVVTATVTIRPATSTATLYDQGPGGDMPAAPGRVFAPLPPRPRDGTRSTQEAYRSNQFVDFARGVANVSQPLFLATIPLLFAQISDSAFDKSLDDEADDQVHATFPNTVCNS